MGGKVKEKNDWLTNSLVGTACIIVILFVLNYNDRNIKIPQHSTIPDWDTLKTSSPISQGGLQSPINIVEFYTYGCGYCKILYHSLTDLRKEFPNEITIYYKPIHMRRYGFDYVTAVAAHCADQQNSFDGTHKFLFEYEGTFPEWEKLAKKASIPDSKKFVKCVKNRETNLKVQRDEIISDSLGIGGVPYLIINGKGYLGSLNYSQLKAILKEDLSK